MTAEGRDLATSALREAILRGEYRAGQRGPSLSELIDRYGISAYHARQVAARLEAEGLLTRIRGAGPVIMHDATPRT